MICKVHIVKSSHRLLDWKGSSPVQAYFEMFLENCDLGPVHSLWKVSGINVINGLLSSCEEDKF